MASVCTWHGRDSTRTRPDRDCRINYRELAFPLSTARRRRTVTLTPTDHTTATRFTSYRSCCRRRNLACVTATGTIRGGELLISVSNVQSVGRTPSADDTGRLGKRARAEDDGRNVVSETVSSVAFALCRNGAANERTRARLPARNVRTSVAVDFVAPGRTNGVRTKKKQPKWTMVRFRVIHAAADLWRNLARVVVPAKIMAVYRADPNARGRTRRVGGDVHSGPKYYRAAVVNNNGFARTRDNKENTSHDYVSVTRGRGGRNARVYRIWDASVLDEHAHAETYRIIVRVTGVVIVTRDGLENLIDDYRTDGWTVRSKTRGGEIKSPATVGRWRSGTVNSNTHVFRTSVY